MQIVLAGMLFGVVPGASAQVLNREYIRLGGRVIATEQPVTLNVDLQPDKSTYFPGNDITFTANIPVVWKRDGTQIATGTTYVFSVPAVAVDTSYVIAAVSVDDPSRTWSKTIAVKPVGVAISPSVPTPVAAGGKIAFSVSLTGTTASYEWSMSPGTAPVAELGAITANIYSAPSAITTGGTLTATVTANTTFTPKPSASVTITLTATLSTRAVSVAATGAPAGTSLVNITVAPGVAWSVSGLPAWLHLSSTSGTGPSAITYSADVNPPGGAQRVANITVAGVSMTVTQMASAIVVVPISFVGSAELSRASQSSSVRVICTEGDTYTVNSKSAAVTITSGQTGLCGQSIGFNVSANENLSTRWSEIVVSSVYSGAGVKYQFTQGPSEFVIRANAQYGSGGTSVSLLPGTRQQFWAFLNGVDVSAQTTWSSNGQGQWDPTIPSIHTTPLSFPAGDTYPVRGKYTPLDYVASIDVNKSTQVPGMPTVQYDPANTGQVNVGTFSLYRINATDPVGNWQRIQTVQVWFSKAGRPVCHATFESNPQAHTQAFRLSNDNNGATMNGLPGDPYAILSVQGCRLRMENSRPDVAVAAGTDTLPVIFEMSFDDTMAGSVSVLGATTTIDNVSSGGGDPTPLTTLTVLTPNRAPSLPTVVPVSPGVNNGALESFNFGFRDPDGNLQRGEVRFRNDATCWLYYFPADNLVKLMSATGGPEQTAQLGFNINEIGHGNCRVNLLYSRGNPVTNGADLSLKMAFHTPMVGSVPVLASAFDSGSPQLYVPFTQIGSWSVPTGSRAASINFVVRQSYLDLLFRDPESQAAIDYASTVPRSSVVRNFAESQEFWTWGGFVSKTYQTVLGRYPGAADWRFQTGALRRGMQSQWGLVSGFVWSAEFQQRYPVAFTDNAEYVRVIYRNALLREPSAAEVNFHVQNWTSREQKALDIMNSAEFLLRHGDRLYIHHLYVSLLRREPEAGAVAWWLTQMSAVGWSKETVAEGFLSSAEFGQRFP